MIFTERTIKIINGSCEIDNPVILYRGDFNVEVRFTIIDCPYKYTTKGSSNVIETTNASHGQLVIKKPDGEPIFSAITAANEGAIVFTITGEMIDEVVELGNYTFQIRLFDTEMESRATIPEVVNGIVIKEPIALEGSETATSNKADVAMADRAIVTAASALEAFDTNGNYNETTWSSGKIISSANLNKIEKGIAGVNQKIKDASLGGGGGGSTSTSASNITITDAANNFTATNVEDALAELKNIGKPTDEQVKTVIDEAIANGDIVAGGLTSTAQTLLISILRNAVFTSDQSANITLLQSELAKGNSGGSSGGGSGITQYAISNNLSNATTNNSAVLVNANASYTATITANDGYELSSITVTMGGTDITSSAVSGTTITISAVTGNVVITVTTTASSSGGGSGEMITNGLVNYFDLRNAKYNNAGAGGSTIITATQGNGSLYCWANNMVTAQDDYGITIERSLFYNANSVGTTETHIKGTFTVAFLGYVSNDKNLFGTWSGYTNLSPEIKLNPTYVDTSNSIKTVTSEKYATSDLTTAPAYRSYILTADEETGIAKVYLGGKLIKTYTGSDYSDFNAWVITTFGVTQKDVVKATAAIVYDRVLSDVEIIDTVDFFSTLEVSN